jgi:NADPH-dependent 2,4-dienoyl-CoA reductase/sulfur reductase-like enzyme
MRESSMAGRHVIAVGGSDAGISAALRAREVDPGCEVTVVLADEYPNFSICGIPYYVSGEVEHWSKLAHRSVQDLDDAGLNVLAGTRATVIDAETRRLTVRTAAGRDALLSYDELVVGTGAVSVVPPISGLAGPDALGRGDGVHRLHTIGDALALVDAITEREPQTVVIVGAGYIGLEMAEALTLRGIRVTQIEALAQVLPTVDADLGDLVRRELAAHGVEVLTGTSVNAIEKAGARLRVSATGAGRQPVSRSVDVVLVVVGVRPDTALARSAGVRLGVRGAVEVDEQMRTGVPHVYAAGDCAVTHHRLLGVTWLPLGTTAHKQGRVAGENAVGGERRFAGSLGTQVVKVFDLVVARTGLREHEAAGADRGWNPVSSTSEPYDHKAYYPGATPITVRVTGDAESGLLLGAQLIGHLGAEVAKRVDIFATALFHGMDI